MKNLKKITIVLMTSVLLLFYSCSDNIGITDEQAERIMEVLSSTSYSISNGDRSPEAKSVESVSGFVELEDKSQEFTYRCVFNNYICMHTDEYGKQTEYLLEGVHHIDVSTPEDLNAGYVYIDIYTDGIEDFRITGGDINSLIEMTLKYVVYSPSEANSWEGSYTCTGTINGVEYIDKPGSLFSIGFVD